MELFLEETSELKKVMLGLINNLKVRYGIYVQYTMCDNAITNDNLNGLANRSGLVSDPSTLHWVLNNKMSMLNRNLLPYSIGCMP